MENFYCVEGTLTQIIRAIGCLTLKVSVVKKELEKPFFFFTKADGGQQRAQIDRGSTCAIATIDNRFFCSNQCSVHPECQSKTTSISDSTTNFLT